MKILVTGSSGFLGKKIIEQLDSHEVFELNRKVGDFQYDLRFFIPEFRTSFDVVIHNAGKAHSFSGSVVEENEIYNVNVGGVKNLLSSLEMFLPQQFIFISSVAVYGRDSGVCIDENQELYATDPYGLSKKLAEEIVQEWCKRFDVKCTILRLPLVVGTNAPGNLGYMLKAIEKGYYFNVSGGIAKRSMVLAEDVAKILLTVSKIGGIYNLTDGMHPSFSEFSENIALQLGSRKPKSIPYWLALFLAYIGDFFGVHAPLNNKKLKKITAHLTFDDSKAKELFGWNPTPVLKGFKIHIS